MKVKKDAIKPVGLTLLYEPDWPIDPAVDIVLVHGVGGHPVQSWKFESQPHTPTAPKATVTAPYPGIKRRLTKPSTPLLRSNSEPLLANARRPPSRSRTLLWKNSTKSSSRLNLNGFAEPIKPVSFGGSRGFMRKAATMSPPKLGTANFADPIGIDRYAEQNVEAYWPLEFLPASCPNARVFTWGYHTPAADKKPVRDEGNIFAHAEELLVELASTRAELGVGARPILLRLSEAERDGPLKGILLSTSAVVFLGSPHRGTEHCNLGDAILSMATATLPSDFIDPSDPVLQELCGTNTAQVELGRQTFVRLWNDYNFKVKTFQESIIPTQPYPELRAETTIRRLASFIGDPREHAETICALHDNICQFRSADDKGYRALAKTLAAFITTEEDGRRKTKLTSIECLSALAQLPPPPPETLPPSAYPGTCLWLDELHDFQTWHHRNGPNKNKILWIRGESGCGKTVLLRSIRRRLERQWGPAGASFIWATAEADDRTKDPSNRQSTSLAGVYRSLLSQLFLHDPRLRKALLALYNQSRTLHDAQVVSFFADYYVNQKAEITARRAFIFVEIADDACPSYVHELIGRLSHLAHNSDFSICVASGYHPEIIEEENVISIPMHLRNADDVLRYVNLNLVAEWEERNRTVIRIGQKSGGVFLWAEIVVNILNAAIMEGATQEMIEYTLEEVPGDLHGLYEWMLSTLNDRERAESLLLFQWVILAAEPMRLNDLFLAVRLTEPNSFALFEQFGPLMAFNIGKPFSMRELRQLRNSEISSDTPYQFHRWLRARSIGLLELKSDAPHRQSTASEPLGLQRVHTIHSSVRSFFLSGRGFACLAAGNPSIPATLPIADFLDITHYTLLRACLTYLNMRDFESLGHGSRRRRKPPTSTTTPSSSSTTSPTLLKLETTLHWHPPPTVSSQRHLIMSSYPLLHYAVTHLLHHLLAPQPFRYFLPQHQLLTTLAANRFRLWKRWTSLLGTYDPDVIVAQHAAPSAGAVAGWLSPVFGARFRLERVLRKLARLAASESYVARRRGAADPVTPVGAVSVSAAAVGVALVPRATRCLAAQQANFATAKRPNPRAIMKSQNAVAEKLATTGAWSVMRGKRKGVNSDKHRVNIVNEKLCDDVIEYLKPTLARHEGCDLVDIFPGVGIWSKKLHEVLKPRSHVLMEPDEEYYKPFLAPLLEQPGTKLLPESGIVWEQLNKILNPTVLPHQVERRYANDETPQRNDTLLVTVNLCMYPRRKFRSFESLAQLVLFQLLAAIRPGSVFQKYGLVRMLIWTEDSEKGAVLPRTVQRRRKMAIEAEISTDWVCEIVGAEAEDAAAARSASWFRRDEALDHESTRRTLERMRQNGFKMPPGREPQHVLDYLAVADLNEPGALDTKRYVGRPFIAELEKLEKKFSDGKFEKKTPEYKRLKTLQYLQTHTTRRSGFVVDLMKEYDAIVQAYIDAGADEKLQEEAAAVACALTDKIEKLEKAFRSDVFLQRDNLHVLRHEPPILNWDRRYVEPLRAAPSDFFPQIPCTLLDIQPKAVPSILRDMGQQSNRGGDTFDLILRGLSQRPIDPISKSLDTIAPGASQGVAPHCPSLFDPRRDGVPRGLPELPARAMSQDQLVEVTQAWMSWPFRPSYSELVSRTLEDVDMDMEEEGRQFAQNE
ncbi:uncharacterized protein B0H64DRAFT_332713 [Chaetomium fimeti]|uniref:Nephrocystin 3-like N-terminal domain-containing protein n=1 Tax=Chaetomium fimeti TaxID=1854472 RepID=A0AAE0H5A9_9PEZI|nr:hypothetical protein B0H64DRAFT_332713 [Chaetomium fimeti]